MSFSAPYTLALFAPLAWAALTLWRGAGAAALPGGWSAWIAPELAGHLARRAGLRASGDLWVALAIAGLLIAAAAGPGIPNGAGGAANLSGRVLVVDATADLPRQRVFITGLAAASPDAPTALIAVAGDAYRLTPFTDDPAQISRYLSALSPDLMPAPGRRLHLGLAEAERALAEAGVLAGQIVLISAAPPPEALAGVGETTTPRLIAPLGPGDWSEAARVFGAEIETRPSAIAAQLDRALRRVKATRIPDARWDLRPILLAAAALLWLVLFRRRPG